MPEPAAFGLGKQVEAETGNSTTKPGSIMLVTTEYSRVRILRGRIGGIVRFFSMYPPGCVVRQYLSERFTLPALLVDQLGAPIYMARVLNNNGSGKECLL